MIHDIQINKKILVGKKQTFLFKFLNLYKKTQENNARVFNFYFKKKVLMIAIVFLPAFSLVSILNNQIFGEFPVQDNQLQIATSTGDILKVEEVIKFSFAESQSHTKIEVSPNIPIKINWNNARTKVSIEPKDSWKKFDSYKIIFTKYSENERDVVISSAIYNFNVEGKPKILKSIPEINSKNAVIENDNVIRIFFDRAILNYEFFAKVKNNEVASKSFNSDNNSLTIILKENIKTKQNLDISIFGRYDNLKSDIDFLGKISMEVIPNKPVVWPSAYEERLNIASEATIPYIGDGKYIDINLKSHVTTLYSDGEVVHQFINSPGAKDSPTITGVFKVQNKALKPVSNTYNVILPYWMAFSEDGMYGLHGLVEWPANHPDFPNSPEGGKESIKSIDRAVSPGCVRHTDEDSKIIYEWSEIGTVVYIY